MNEIRIATFKDIDNLLHLFKYGYSIHLKKRPDKFIVKTDEEYIKTIKEFIEDENLSIFIYCKDNEIIGYLAFEIIDKATKYIWVDELVISEDYQNKGYGKELLKKLEEYAKSIQCKRIEFGCWCFNRKAMAIYEHMGFYHQKVIFEKEL